MMRRLFKIIHFPRIKKKKKKDKNNQLDHQPVTHFLSNEKIKSIFYLSLFPPTSSSSPDSYSQTKRMDKSHAPSPVKRPNNRARAIDRYSFTRLVLSETFVSQKRRRVLTRIRGENDKS